MSINLSYLSYRNLSYGKTFGVKFIWYLIFDRFISISVSIGGSVVECSPATRATRVRFPADAHFSAPTIRANEAFSIPFAWHIGA